jgi:ubiquinone/menaquinone biosynthesis C-methylase UbiE
MHICFDTAGEIYDKTRGLPNHVMEQLVNRMTDELKDHQTVLDVGVGTGRFAKPLQEKGFKVVGVDLSGKMLNKAVENGVEDLLRCDACFLPLTDKSFDGSLCIHVLHLISDWRIALQEICRVTRKIMLSMIHVQNDPVRQAYNTLLCNLGYERTRPGKDELELQDFVKAKKSVFAASYNNRADEHLENLAQRAFTSQWQIPEDINRKIVAELKEQFADKTFSQELRVLIWDINDLESIALTSQRT